jgi:SAM-dependent methyltransferase
LDDSYVATADLYDFIPEYQTRPDVSFFVELAREAPGPVLELGCGTGRVLIPTARAGVNVVGVDTSAEMLAVCDRKLQDEPREVRSRVRLLQADMRQFELSQRFALVVIPFRPFQHLVEVDEQLACLECIRRHLQDDGKLIVDVFNPSLTALTRANLGVEEVAEPEFTLPDGRRVVRRQKIAARDLFKQVISVELIYYVTYPDGRSERLVHAFSMRYFFRYEMEHLLERGGFTVEALYGNYEREPYDSTDPAELIFVARKRS